MPCLIAPLLAGLAAGGALGAPVPAGAPAPLVAPAADPESVTVRLPDTHLEFELVHVHGAALPAGDDGVAPVVDDFWMARTEVTWDLYDWYFLGFDVDIVKRAKLDGTTRPSKPYGAVDRGFGHSGFPALGMTRKAAEAYCGWLGETTGHAFRLPTEHEWLLAAGAFDAEPDARPLAERAWFFDNARDRTHKVGKRAPNARGLHDMLGNAAEHVAADGDEAQLAVVRGGSYLDFAEDVHVHARAVETRAWKATDPQIPKSEWWFKDGPFVGLRVVCDERPRAPDERAGDADTHDTDTHDSSDRPDTHDDLAAPTDDGAR